jgi:hypothetical protein
MKGLIVALVLGASVATVGFAETVDIAEQMFYSAKEWVVDFNVNNGGE